MNTTKVGSYGKLIAFFLVAIILLCTFGFAVEGWQPNKGGDASEGKLPSGENTGTGGSVDAPTGTLPDEPDVPPAPVYYDRLTGLEISEEESTLRHLCFVMSSDAPLYGLSLSQVLVEIPTEGSETRLLAFTRNAKNIGKIGSIAPTRDSFKNVCNALGGLLVSYGSDDITSADQSSASHEHLDLKSNVGYGYSEFTKYFYSNGDLLYAGLTNLGFSTSIDGDASSPFTFTDGGVEGDTVAISVTLPFSDTASTELIYSASLDEYVITKNGAKLDALTDSPLSFKNALVLFADSVTYESEDGEITILDTAGGGKGYYMTEGAAQSITWSTDELGNMILLDSEGKLLSLNPGKSYIAFMKSSKMSAIKIS